MMCHPVKISLFRVCVRVRVCAPIYVLCVYVQLPTASLCTWSSQCSLRTLTRLAPECLTLSIRGLLALCRFLIFFIGPRLVRTSTASFFHH